MHEIGKGKALKSSTHDLIDDPLIVFSGAATLDLAKPGNFGAAVSQCNGAFESGDHLCNRNLVSIARQDVPTFGATLRSQKSVM